ncbi:MAG: NDP-sugar synthase [Deltaproteobacteria bacterium]|nr:NDP-sugar synthase [Deltaproteobacteria bacterium]
MRRGGIIAAGTGSRFKARGILTPKPLIPVGGVPLIERTLRALQGAEIGEVACIVNEDEGPAVQAFVAALELPVSLRWVRRSTPSSMHSLFALREALEGEPFLLTTVDAIYPPKALAEFVAHAGVIEADVCLALTEFVDDDKPLWARLDQAGWVTALGEATAGSAHVTAGLYACAPRIFAEAEPALQARLGALREFLQWLLRRGYRLAGWAGPRVVDVDRPEDIAVAEAWLRQEGWA